jgi:hypothetical protein
MLSKKPIIFATGCSFTDPDFESTHEDLPDIERGGWPMWPEIIKDKLNKEIRKPYELINVAKSGAGNEYILMSIQDALVKYGNRIKIILIGGTQWMRYHHVPTNTMTNPLFHIKAASERSSKEQQARLIYAEAENQGNIDRNSWINKFIESDIQMWKKWSNEAGIGFVINHNIRIMWTILSLCKLYNIKLIWNQLLYPMPGYDFWKQILDQYESIEDENIQEHVFTSEWTTEYFLKSNYAKDLITNSKCFWGFPWSKGEYFDTKKHDELIVKPPIEVNGQIIADFHPNKIGQEKIAETMWKNYANYLVKN